MTNEPSNKVTATVESARLAKRKEEGARMFAVLSFPIRGNNHLLEMLASHLQNPVDVTFEPIQASLPSVLRPPTTETVEMSVDGEPAKVTRTKRGRNGATPEPEIPSARSKTRADWEAEGSPAHAFLLHAADNQCFVCGLAPEHEHHQQEEHLGPAAAALIEEARAGVEVSQRKPTTVEEEREQEAARRRLVGHT